MQSGEVVALHPTDLEITAGEDVAIVGPSGSGKSTLMNLLGGLDRPSEGDIEIEGLRLSDLNANQLAAFRNRSVGFVFQQFNLLPNLSALDNVALPLLYRKMSRNDRRNRANEILQNLGLGDRIGHKPSQLSGGQQQRVAIARALVGKPPLILADEPTGSLDSTTSAEILHLLRGLRLDGVTLVIVTHDAEVARGASRRIRFHDGRIVGDDANGQVLVEDHGT